MRYLSSLRSDRSGATAILLLVGVFLFSPATFGSSTAEKLSRASLYYDQAEKALLALQNAPAEQRSQRDYERVIQAYWRVYRTAPSSSKNTKSLMTIAELYQAMAHNLKKERYFASAAEAYDFLCREYPHTKYQADALLATARIYRSDLRQPEEALKRFELILQKYPGSPQVDEARLAVSDIQTKMAAGKTEEPPAAAPPSAPEQAGKVPEKSGDRLRMTDIRKWITPTSTRIVIDVAGEVKYAVGRLSNPPRIYVDLHGTKVDRAVAGKTLALDGELVKRVRVAQNKEDVTRVVLEVDKLTDYSIFDLPNPYRLIVDIHSPDQKAPAPSEQVPSSDEGQQAQPNPSAPPEKAGKEVAPSPAEKPVPPSGPAIDKAIVGPASERLHPVRLNRDRIVSKPATVEKAVAVPVSEKVPPATDREQAPASLPALSKVEGSLPKGTENREEIRDPAPETVQTAQPNRDGTRSLTRALGLKIGRIILDPGHGGHDTGTIGPSGLYEKDLVLDVALRLGKLISQRLGSEVIYTRQDDTFIPLESRTAIANEKQADLFLSIHANSSQSHSARGVETYYLSFATDPEAMAVAARENAVSQGSVHELPDLVKKIALNEKVDESKEFASDVQLELRDRLSKGTRQRKDRGVKKAPFMVLVGARMPSVLAEISFLSNPQEEKLLHTKAQRQKIAEALYAGIKRYTDTLSGIKVARNENIAAK